MWSMGHSPERGQESLHVPQVSSPVYFFQDLHPHVVHVLTLVASPQCADIVPRLFTFSLSSERSKVHKRVPVWLCCGMDLTWGS